MKINCDKSKAICFWNNTKLCYKEIDQVLGLVIRLWEIVEVLALRHENFKKGQTPKRATLLTNLSCVLYRSMELFGRIRSENIRSRHWKECNGEPAKLLQLCHGHGNEKVRQLGSEMSEKKTEKFTSQGSFFRNLRGYYIKVSRN